MATITRNGSLPFVWLAGFNENPIALRQEPCCDWLAAEVIVPDKQITCHMGSGSLIDYGVCSRCLSPYIAEFAVVTVCLGGHTTVSTYICTEPPPACHGPRPSKTAAVGQGHAHDGTGTNNHDRLDGSTGHGPRAGEPDARRAVQRCSGTEKVGRAIGNTRHI